MSHYICLGPNKKRNQPEKPFYYMQLMQKFSKTRKEKCKYTSDLINKVQPRRSKKLFSTGSTYDGMWTLYGMGVYGTYTLPHGVAYKGELDDEGMFHGNGSLIYPSGDVIKGKWNHGEFTGKKQLFFHDGVEFPEGGGLKYCQLPDRRYAIEFGNNLQPAGQSFITAEQPTREIPHGCYDCGEGFYMPSYKCFYRPNDMNEIVSLPQDEQEWILRNCRKSPDDPVGPIPDFYETFYKPTSSLDPTTQEEFEIPVNYVYGYNIRKWSQFHFADGASSPTTYKGGQPRPKVDHSKVPVAATKKFTPETSNKAMSSTDISASSQSTLYLHEILITGEDDVKGEADESDAYTKNVNAQSVGGEMTTATTKGQTLNRNLNAPTNGSKITPVKTQPNGKTPAKNNDQTLDENIFSLSIDSEVLEVTVKTVISSNDSIKSFRV